LFSMAQMHRALREAEKFTKASGDNDLEHGFQLLNGSWYRDLTDVIDADPEYASRVVDVLRASPYAEDRVLAGDVLTRHHRNLSEADLILDPESEIARWRRLLDGEPSEGVLEEHKAALEILINDLGVDLNDSSRSSVAPFLGRVMQMAEGYWPGFEQLR